MRLGDLVAVLGPDARCQGTEELLDRPVNGISCDSRKVGPGWVFVALRGVARDGHRYVPQALAAGCLAAVVEDRGGMSGKGKAGDALIRVRDSHAAYGLLAGAWYGNPARKLSLVGITGTNGKTTTAWLLAAIFAAAGERCGNIGTIQYSYPDREGRQHVRKAALTTPDPMLLQQILRSMADAGVRRVVMEVSSHALVQQRVAGLHFDVAVFTNLSRDHLDFHRNMEEYFHAKQLLFTRYLAPSGTAVIVVGEEAEGADWGRKLAARLERDPAFAGSSRLVTCGLDSADVTALELDQRIDGCRYILVMADQRLKLRSPLVGRHNVLNALAAAGAAQALGKDPADIVGGIGDCRGVPGRLERVQLQEDARTGQPAVFVDYAHTPDALAHVLGTLRELTPGRLVCVFGCGGDRDRGKRFAMGEAAARYSDIILLTSDNPRSEHPDDILAEIVPGVRKRGKKHFDASRVDSLFETGDGYAVVGERETAIHLACSLGKGEDVVLIAGKGHETYQLVGDERRFFDDRLAAADGLLRWNQEHLLAATGGRIISGRQPVLLNTVSTDSRTVRKGDVFVALEGERFDGHDFLATAVANGAAAAIVHKDVGRMADDVLLIRVEDTLQALGNLAGYRRRLLGERLQVIAITGSSGKTTVKEMTAAIFDRWFSGADQEQKRLLKTKGNFNNLVGLPLSLLPVQATTQVAVLEMGMNRPGEIGRLTEICDPDIGCINNVQPAHLEGLGSIDRVARAKGELFAGMRAGAARIINCDDPLVRELPVNPAECVGFAVTPEGFRCDPVVRITDIRELGEQGARCVLDIGDWRGTLTVNLPGLHNISNCAAAAAICHAAGLPPEVIGAGLEDFQGYSQRMQVVPGCRLRVVNDSYNANPASMEAALRTVSSFGGPDCRRLAVLGDMLELGREAANAHARIGTLVARLGYDYLAVTGAHRQEVATAAREAGMPGERVQAFADKADILSWLHTLLNNGAVNSRDWLLIKGSRGMRMETLLDGLGADRETAEALG